MWTQELLGTDLYHVIAAFLIYSLLGWLAESIYMSFCNRKITNRGFSKGPFCPIYGFGGVIGYAMLHSFAGDYLKLYIVGALMATAFEYLVGRLMIRLFGELWWDYHDKPCNYKGIICLESTVAWGFYAMIIVLFLNHKVMEFIDAYSVELGQRTCMIVFTVVLIDFIYHLLVALGVNVKEYREKLADKYQSFKARWY